MHDCLMFCAMLRTPKYDLSLGNPLQLASGPKNLFAQPRSDSEPYLLLQSLYFRTHGHNQSLPLRSGRSAGTATP